MPIDAVECIEGRSGVEARVTRIEVVSAVVKDKCVVTCVGDSTIVPECAEYWFEPCVCWYQA